MIQKTIERLQYLCNTIPVILTDMNEGEFSFKPSPDKWSKKEILGHLIDSATNNHHRFIRVQIEDIPLIRYDQNQWNRAGQYAQMDSKRLVSFWSVYNRHLTELLKLIPAETLSRTCNVGKEEPVTLEWLINDYVRHLEHHLQQIIEH